jgi:hypothetical protein
MQSETCTASLQVKERVEKRIGSNSGVELNAEVLITANATLPEERKPSD